MHIANITNPHHAGASAAPTELLQFGASVVARVHPRSSCVEI